MTIREKILVIEDEKSISHFISTVLNNNGYEAMQAQTGEEALSMISSHCPDLVILDLGLPDMDGLDILRSLRSWSSLPVVVVSARSHERDKVAALDLGADDYLTKPFELDELAARVGVQLRHHLLRGCQASVRDASPSGQGACGNESKKFFPVMRPFCKHGEVKHPCTGSRTRASA